MSDRFDAIVIGSGLGGLTAGALFARGGRRVLLLERNQSFGGAATTYQHGSLTVETSLHEIDGLDGRDAKLQIFEALGVSDLDFVPIQNCYEVRNPLFGEPFVLPHGLEAAITATNHHFPNQEKAVSDYFAGLRTVRDALGLMSEHHDGLWWLAHAPTLPWRLWPLLRDRHASVSDFMQRALGDNESLKLALAANLSYYSDDPAKLWWLAFAIAQSSYLFGGGHYIKGGSQTLSNRLVSIIESEGGATMSGRNVTKILTDSSGCVSGVEHVDTDTAGNHCKAFASVLFGNAAPHILVETLPAEHRSRFMAPYADRPVSISLFSVSLGFNRRPSEFGVKSYSTFVQPQWLTSLAGFPQSTALMGENPSVKTPMFAFTDYDRIDSGLNAEPPYLGNICGSDRMSNWADLNESEYNDRRERWMDHLLSALDKEFPGIASAVVQREMATPVTMHHYLNTPDGALYGFAPLPPKGMPSQPISPKTPIDGLWLASVFGGFGGYTGAIMTGAAAARAALNSKH